MYQNETQNQKIYDFHSKLDRSFFIDNEYKELAHYDRPLPIGYDVTISQPSLVIEMTMLLNLTKECKVLEIGTGSGYQTAFLAEFAGEVFTIERVEELSKKAQKRLIELGYKNIKFKIGDGSKGWKEFAPYNRIIATAGAGDIPKELLNQLELGGRMIIPVGEKGLQELLLVTKSETGDIQKESLGQVRFVEFKGKYGWN